MQKKRLVPFLVLFCFVAFTSPRVDALGLGAGPQSVPLGQALDLAVQVRLDAGETLTPECVQAEVWVGEQRPLPATVSTRLNAAANTAIIRIGTSAAIDEPVVTVQVHAGCGARVSRRYVAFADPGNSLALAAPAVALPQAENLAERAPLRASVAQAVAAVESVAPPVARPAPVRASGPRERSTRRTRSELRAQARAEARAERLAQRRNAGAASAPPRPSAVVSARGEAMPRLRLDPAEAAPASTSNEVIEQALEAVALAASDARASAAAASATAQRIAELERGLERSRNDARASQTEVERLRLQMNRPQLAQDWLWPLIALLGVLVALAAWMAWRLRAMQRTQEVAWARASALAAVDVPVKSTSPLPLINARSQRAAAFTAATGSALDTAPDKFTPAGANEYGLELAMARTAVLPPNARVEETSPRDVSIEELIDIDQQAEFFIALGQDNAAIDMLVAHLRNTGGGSPLTYLKLLEIYRRVGDQSAYERTRTRFNQRYNAYAPEWGSDLTHGKALEDYSAVVPRLTQAWPRPLDAMAELEALLFRKSRGELFELPAYRDVLFLYALARDLMDREPTDAQAVDLLLPLDANSRAAATVGDSRAMSDVTPDDQPTSPLDLDLTPPPRTHESIFGEPLTPTSGIARDSRY